MGVAMAARLGLNVASMLAAAGQRGDAAGDGESRVLICGDFRALFEAVLCWLTPACKHVTNSSGKSAYYI